MFREHIRLHPSIPYTENGDHRTTIEIHKFVTAEMYNYCRGHNLAQAWAYLWNQWYSPEQWKLWSLASKPFIPHINTTMIVESLWMNLKHKDLAMYHRPRLDLVTYVVINSLLPRIKLTLQNLRETRRVGRGLALKAWQKALKAKWEDCSRSDEERLCALELEVRKKAKTGEKGREEKLASIEEAKTRKPGKYHTDINSWVCSCRDYLICRFLTCKHLIREANTALKGLPLDKR
ncbi:hypothetical protein BDP27DRAFT_1164517, partial [Rhodocollybia butyracea]